MTSVQVERKPNYLWRQLRLLQKEFSMSGEDKIAEGGKERTMTLEKPEKMLRLVRTR